MSVCLQARAHMRACVHVCVCFVNICVPLHLLPLIHPRREGGGSEERKGGGVVGLREREREREREKEGERRRERRGEACS